MKRELQAWFFRSILGEVYIRTILWWDYRQFRKGLKRRPNLETAKLVMSMSQTYYTEGLKAVRSKIQTLVNTKDPEKFDADMKKLNELLSLADGSKSAGEIKDIEYLKALLMRRGVDIKTPEDKERMIESRIMHYKELQNHKLEREFISKIKIARRSGNEKLANKLEKEWHEKFRRDKRKLKF